MIRHVVAWDYREGFSDAENRENALRVKTEAEALIHSVEGIVEIKVHTDLLGSSERDVVLSSLHESEEALAAYQAHPEHQKVAAFIGTVLGNRVCVDYPE